MNKPNILVVLSKSKDGWNLYTAGDINQSVIGLKTKDQAKYIWGIIKRVYNQGRYDEFEENNKKTNLLMERFGI